MQLPSNFTLPQSGLLVVNGQIQGQSTFDSHLNTASIVEFLPNQDLQVLADHGITF